MIDGRLRVNGDIIEVPAQGVEMARTGETSADTVQVRLVIASAKPAPDHEPRGVFALQESLIGAAARTRRSARAVR